MAIDPHASARVPPSKPWERTIPYTGSSPFNPPSQGSTSNAVEASGTGNPGQINSTDNRCVTASAVTLSRTLPAHPWEQHNCSRTYRGESQRSGYNSSLYDSSYHGYRWLYGGGLHGNQVMYGGGYGGGMYNNGFGGLRGAEFMPMAPQPHGGHDLNCPPASPPTFSLLQEIQGAVTFYSNIVVLVDENTQALHMFLSALFMLLDRVGFLYGELSRLESLRKLTRFVFGILGIRRKFQSSAALQSPLKGPKASAKETSWDTVWTGKQ